MKIGHYMRGIWEKGGVASYIRRISAEQTARGCEVRFFDNREFDSPVAHPIHDQPVTFVRDDHELFAQAKDEGLDILHVHIAVEAGVRLTVPTIRTVHGHQAYCPSGSRFLKRNDSPCDRAYSLAGCLWGHVVDRCGSVRPNRLMTDFKLTRDELAVLGKIPSLTVSRFLKEQMVRSGHREENIDVLYLPAPAPKGAKIAPSPKEGAPHFVFAGRLTPQKGVAWLLKAASRVESDIHINIAGDGYLHGELKALSHRLGIEDRVTFHGWVDADKINSLLMQARALVFPSVWHEPGGTVAFEAMVNGRAVVMSRVGGMPEVVVDGGTGILVDPGDVEGLARAISRLAADWHEAHLLGEQGYASVQERFGMEQHMGRLMGHYDQCRARFTKTVTVERSRSTASTVEAVERV